MNADNELTEFSYEGKLDKTEPAYSFHRFYYRKFISRNATYFLLNMPNNNCFLILTLINLLLDEIIRF